MLPFQRCLRSKNSQYRAPASLLTSIPRFQYSSPHLHIRPNAHRTARTVRGNRRNPRTGAGASSSRTGWGEAGKLSRHIIDPRMPIIYQPGNNIASSKPVQRGFNMTSNPSSASLRRSGRFAPEFFVGVGAVGVVSVPITRRLDALHDNKQQDD